MTRPYRCWFSAVVLLLLAACAHPSRPESPVADLPVLKDPNSFLAPDPRLTAFRQDPIRLQPWLAGPRTPPTCLADLGLEAPLELLDVRRSLNGDQNYVISDARGRYFQFCTTAGPMPPAFFLGAEHWSRLGAGAIEVRADSASYRFLTDLLWAFAEDPRYQYDPEFIRRAAETCPDEKSRALMLKVLTQKKRQR